MYVMIIFICVFCSFISLSLRVEGGRSLSINLELSLELGMSNFDSDDMDWIVIEVFSPATYADTRLNTAVQHVSNLFNMSALRSAKNSHINANIEIEHFQDGIKQGCSTSIIRVDCGQVWQDMNGWCRANEGIPKLYFSCDVDLYQELKLFIRYILFKYLNNIILPQNIIAIDKSLFVILLWLLELVHYFFLYALYIIHPSGVKTLIYRAFSRTLAWWNGDSKICKRKWPNIPSLVTWKTKLHSLTIPSKLCINMLGKRAI